MVQPLFNARLNLRRRPQSLSLRMFRLHGRRPRGGCAMFRLVPLRLGNGARGKPLFSGSPSARPCIPRAENQTLIFPPHEIPARTELRPAAKTQNLYFALCFFIAILWRTSSAATVANWTITTTVIAMNTGDFSVWRMERADG